MKHDKFKNKYSFDKDEKYITLVPLTPQYVYNDQMKLRGEEERKGKEKQNESSRENGEVTKCERAIREKRKRVL